MGFLKDWMTRTAQEKLDRRTARIDRWDRPIGGWRDRMAVWLNAHIVDHAFVRFFYLNEHKVTERLRRAAQPLPGHIARWGREGVKTIIILRAGRQYGSWPLEKEAAAKAGIRIEELILRSRAAPTPSEIKEAKELFARIAYPAVLHCKSGADRAGIASALHLLLCENADIDTAEKQLSLVYGHIKGSKTGILDASLEAYRHYRNETANPVDFFTWSQTLYDPQAVVSAFRPRFLASFFGDTVLDRE